MARWLITGVSSGIGAALARLALDAGDSVVGTVRNAAAAGAFESLAPTRARAVLLDVTDEAAVSATVATLLAEAPIDILVNNAGQSLFGAFEEVSVAELGALFAVNLFGPWAVTQSVLPHFRARGSGRIIFLSSGCGLNGIPGLSAYCATKHAVEGAAEALAQEVAGFGIQVMIVEPGAVASRFISHGTQDTGRRLPDYAGLTGGGKDALEGYYESAASSPDAVAAAIHTAATAPDMPARLLIGADVKPGAEAKGLALLDLARR